MVRNIPTFFQQKQKQQGTLSEYWQQIEELYTKKLWHQLTLKLLEVIQDKDFLEQNSLIEVYNEFIADFDHRINPMSLAEIGTTVAEQMFEKKCAELDEIAAFLSSLQTKVKANDEATVLCISCMSTLKVKQALKLQQVDGKATEVEALFKEISTLIEDGNITLDKIDGVTKTHGRFYEMASDYHRLLGNHSDYYKHALRFLGCTELEEIPIEKRQHLAFSLGLAALLADDVYNFGELLQHDILKSLDGTKQVWLVELLFTFNSGNLQKFIDLQPKWRSQTDLVSHETTLRRKICLLCLMEMVFKRPAADRKLSFQEIAQATMLPSEEVELLVMKALSLKLVKGYIDQVEQLVYLNWVQPRVLDKQQLAAMRDKLVSWCSDVQSLETIIGEHAVDILAN